MCRIKIVFWIASNDSTRQFPVHPETTRRRWKILPVPMLHDSRVVSAYIKNPWYSTSSVNFLTFVLSYPQKTRPKTRQGRKKPRRNREETFLWIESDIGQISKITLHDVFVFSNMLWNYQFIPLLWKFFFLCSLAFQARKVWIFHRPHSMGCHLYE